MKGTDRKQAWILAGYELFSKEGPNGLKVEVIARKVNKSKSSFYHHFSDIEIFTSFLLKHHLKRTSIIAERERLCKTINPDLINILVDVKEDLLFNRQLRVHRTNAEFRACFEQSNQEIVEVFLTLWAEDIGLKDKPQLALLVLSLAIENFYLQITEETLTFEWLSSYFKKIHSMVAAFKNQ